MPFCVPAHHQLRRGQDHRVLAAALIFTLIASQAVSAGAATYYVDNQSANCSNVGAGTEAQPYCTISAAVAVHNGPGTTIIVKPGVYREQVTVPASGAAGLPFVIQASGPGVVVEGTDDFTGEGLWSEPVPQWIPRQRQILTTDGAWLASGVTWPAQQVFVDGIRMTASTSSPEELPVNAFTWVSGKGLYVNLGGANPGLRETLVGRRNHGFNLFGKSWVSIDGFEIARSEERGVNIQTGCSNLVISRNRVSFTQSYGIQSVGGVNLTIEENVVSDCGLHGIGLTAGTTGCVIRNNESFRNVDPSTRRANGIYLFAAPSNTLYGNRLHDNQDSGMHFATGANNCLAYNNRAWKNGDHGFDDLNASGTVHLNDVAFGNYKDGFSIEGNAPNSQLHNCIAVDNGLTTNGFNLWVNDSSSVGFVSDHNIFWNSTAQAPIKYITTIYATLAGFQAASGQDANSRQADPKFVNGSAGNFMLSAGSPAIDAASSSVPNWPATDAVGHARVDDLFMANSGAGPVAFGDIGALEFVPATDLPPVVQCPSMVRPYRNTTVTFTVTASDPEGQPIQTLTMVPLTMPANSGAVFTTNATQTVGTFTWVLGSFTGDYKVAFAGTNSLTGLDTTSIRVRQTLLADGAIASEGGFGDVLALSNGFPNPAHGEVGFALDVPRESQLSWAVFDLQGRMVWSEERNVGAGRTQLRWDGMSSSRARAATGVYLVRASVEGTQFSRRIVRF